VQLILIMNLIMKLIIKLKEFNQIIQVQNPQKQKIIQVMEI
jgi:hypothetical protein